MKKIISMILAVAMLGSLVGCGGSKEEEAATETNRTSNNITTIDIDPAEYVELGQYKGIKISKAKVEVTDQDVDEEIENTRVQYSDYKKVKRDTVQADDIVNVSFVCTVGGTVMENYTENDYDMSIGMGEMIFGEDLDLEEALIGAKVGKTTVVKGTFFADEADEEVAGKKAQFRITVNYISEEVLPEFTDEFVKENFDYDTFEQYRESVRQELMEQAKSDEEEQNFGNLWEEVVKNSKQIKDFPAETVEKEIANASADGEEWAEYFDMSVEEYFKEMYGMTVEEYAKDSIFRQCVLQLLVDAEHVSPTDEEIDAVIEEEKENGGYESIEDVLAYTSREEFADQLTFERAMQIVTENATIE